MKVLRPKKQPQQPRTEAALKKVVEPSAILDAIAGPVAVLDRKGLLLAANAAWKRAARSSSLPFPRLGPRASYFDVCRLVVGDEAEAARKILAGVQAVRDGVLAKFAHEYPSRSSKAVRWFVVQATPLSRTGGVVLSHQDITALKHQQLEQDKRLKALEVRNQELDQIAIRDPLTGLYNRRFFDEVLTREWRRFQRTGEAFTIIIMDVDAFKSINDRYGHEIGDQALQQVGAGLRATLRASDLVARVGGDEFAALLPRTDTERSRPVIEKLRDTIKLLRLNTESGPLPVSLSLGTATVPGFPPVTSAAELLRVADKHMYEAKRRYSESHPGPR
ncbi:MAG: GGDEF domain-containing protein [Nitrospirota bacterium]|nr:GGDEF domain-containing protein [Nitrospirota bacterium]MDE3117438.1 GGDEF domain-containing protein [Nitrospirota bacterium]MDE3224295.1 GGDEF domain-containing protein [Nitrospirota bacterium]MDE3242417.1 GGDEF domain-containing protein [Nitrospirota bacterium]